MPGLILLVLTTSVGFSQQYKPVEGEPRVVIATGKRSASQMRYTHPSPPVKYPWKTYVTATIFWCGEKPTQNNPVPNCKSSWDVNWKLNFGGYDNPDPAQRIADHNTGEFRPKGFVPKLNPFYIALPYNDVLSWNAHKPEASKVIPWFSKVSPLPGKTVLKGRWIQIFINGRSCYAQWEDCGPWVTDDWQYVFGNKKPKTSQNGAAGIDVSPAVRDYLGIRSGDKVHWRFVEESHVPYGPWKKYGARPPAANEFVRDTSWVNKDVSQAEREYVEYIRELRERQQSKNSRE